MFILPKITARILIVASLLHYERKSYVVTFVNSYGSYKDRSTCVDSESGLNRKGEQFFF